MNSNYSVPIIPQNLSKHETVIQIAEVLNHLSNITEDIFQKVNTRLDSNNKTLSNISDRVSSANAKINQLKGAKKATQVFSSSKYPAADVNRQYVSLFEAVQPIELKRHKVKQKSVQTTYEPSDKLQVYHVKISSSESKEKLNGLGKIPLDIECVNDLLLYNSGKNLYKNFVMSDALKGNLNIREDDTIDASAIGAAPYSISERSTLTKSTAHSYFYTPKIGEVPALDVPLDLPDLPGVADDLRYENTLGPAIAPSASSPPNITDLPTVEEVKIDSKTIEVLEVNLPPPPPPVTINDAPIKPKETVEELPKVKLPEVPKVEVKLPMPPPPPPPPPPAEIVAADIAAPVLKLPTSGDARANLMDAIRKAGGAKKLKTTKPKETKTKSVAPSGDLMADLHSKLLLRRKGISGTKKQEQENSIDAASTLGRLSSLIPPPKAKSVQESTTTEDEDWDE